MGLPEESQKLGQVSVERIHLRTEPGIVVPVILLVPSVKEGKTPVVVCLAQEGKHEFLQRRSCRACQVAGPGSRGLSPRRAWHR